MAVPLVPGPGLGDANAAQKSMSTLLKNQCDFCAVLIEPKHKVDWRVAMGPSKPGALAPARRADRGKERSRGPRAREGKRPCRIVRRVFGYAKVRYCGIAKGASAHPRPARQRRPARVRQGREAGGVPGGHGGGRLTAAEGTVCREGARRGREGARDAPGGRRGPKVTKIEPSVVLVA